MSNQQAPFVQKMPSDFSLVDAFLRLCERPGCLWLDSSSPTRQLDEGSPPVGRYSFLTSDPIETIVANPEDPNPWPQLHQLYAALPSNYDPQLPPFQGGIAGLWGYEAINWLESIESPQSDAISVPALSVGLYDWTLATDHLLESSWLICQGRFHENWAERCKLAKQRAKEILDAVTKHPPNLEKANKRPSVSAPNHSVRTSAGIGTETTRPETTGEEAWLEKQYVTQNPKVKSNFAPEQFPNSVKQIVDAICEGDTFQVNLAQRLLAIAADSSPNLYLRLREVNPAPFSAYYQQSDYQIASSSPEGFLQVRGREVETRPIKGTVPRTGEQTVDRELAEQLIASEKDRAENIMIVDLLRNDLSKSCEDDSVVVTKLCGLEIYEHIQHLVSVVKGTLREDQTASQLLESCFPGGSVTGAPKIEAMKTIAKIEPNRRGAYCGSIGYLGLGSQADFNILIRTVTATQGYWQFPVGGGITAKSQPSLEEAETWAKAEGMLRAIAPNHDQSSSQNPKIPKF